MEKTFLLISNANPPICDLSSALWIPQWLHLWILPLPLIPISSQPILGLSAHISPLILVLSRSPINSMLPSSMTIYICPYLIWTFSNIEQLTILSFFKCSFWLLWHQTSLSSLLPQWLFLLSFSTYPSSCSLLPESIKSHFPSPLTYSSLVISSGAFFETVCLYI